MEMHEKYSVPVKENRCYNRSFYEYGISAFPEQLCQSDFVIGDKHYYWMSLDEMAGDARIVKVNGDILEIVASLNKLDNKTF